MKVINVKCIICKKSFTLGPNNYYVEPKGKYMHRSCKDKKNKK